MAVSKSATWESQPTGIFDKVGILVTERIEIVPPFMTPEKGREAVGYPSSKSATESPKVVQFEGSPSRFAGAMGELTERF
jgi:hypothetical protein